MVVIMVTSFNPQSRLKSFSEGGPSMKKTILAKHVLRLSTLLLSLLLLISLGIGTVSAGSRSKEDKTDPAKDMVIRHMDAMRQKFPEIDEQVRQTEEGLSTGAMSPRRACSNCHIQE
jgi:hypothetical protein